MLRSEPSAGGSSTPPAVQLAGADETLTLGGAGSPRGPLSAGDNTLDPDRGHGSRSSGRSEWIPRHLSPSRSERRVRSGPVQRGWVKQARGWFSLAPPVVTRIGLA